LQEERVKVLVPSSIDLSGVGAEVDDVVRYDEQSPFDPATRDADVLVVWGNSTENLRDAAEHLVDLRLVQSLAAGVDAIVRAGFPASVPVATGRSLHDGPVAEHALALTLAAVRRLDRLRESQQRAHWDTEFLQAQVDPATAATHTLDGAHVALWGFGSIAARLAPMLTALGARVTGIASTAGERHGYPVVAAERIAELLPEVDVLISILPHTAATEGALDADLLSRMKPTAVFVNVGRGATVDEDALMEALSAGRLHHAALDVVRQEPLPADSPLWSAPNLVLTPHAAGNRPQHAAALVNANLEALRHGSPVLNRFQPA
jgi:phosphoglycerate dehydrogenase-like enzyme